MFKKSHKVVGNIEQIISQGWLWHCIITVPVLVFAYFYRTETNFAKRLSRLHTGLDLILTRITQVTVHQSNQYVTDATQQRISQ